jgi:hypothetical protein
MIVIKGGNVSQASYVYKYLRPEPDSSVSVVSDYGLDDGFDPRQRQRIFLLGSVPRQAVGPTQPPVQWTLGVLSPGIKHGPAVMLTTDALLLPRLPKNRAIPPLRQSTTQGV